MGACCRVKEIAREDQRFRLVEFQTGFEEDGWCEKAHVGYVLEGTLRIDLPDQTLQAKAGDVLWIPAGHETRHRAEMISEAVRLILFEEPEER